jgi:hypothetical protein
LVVAPTKDNKQVLPVPLVVLVVMVVLVVLVALAVLMVLVVSVVVVDSVQTTLVPGMLPVGLAVRLVKLEPRELLEILQLVLAPVVLVGLGALMVPPEWLVLEV